MCFLEAAAALGRTIVAQAIWDAGRCTWVGAVPGAKQPEYAPLGPHLYDGTAGVALFLRQLHAATGDDSFRRTCDGALRHAVERARGEGFWGGAPGIAWAAGIAPAASEPSTLDLMDGAAGSLVAHLAGGQLTAARRLGDLLLERSVRGAWPPPGRGSPRPLCGLAHGAGGIAWALLELWGATGDERYRAGADAGFAYERAWLDRATGTWPDLRLPIGRGGGAITGSWRHGEAGIALSRLRARELLDDPAVCQDANIAIATAKRYLEAALPYAYDDLSLCHGLGGTADALISAGEAEPARALGHAVLERAEFPCGAPGTTPSLFRGLAGIGWLFLRLHDPSTPSPLTLPQPA